MWGFKDLVNRIGGQAMNANMFWFSDEQWSKIEPHLPTNNLVRTGRMIGGF